ncbi:hypothetical protein [Halochromatium sp.]
MKPDIIGHCWHCGAGLTRADYGRENHCLSCSKPTRACRNCRLYQRGRPNDCLEPLAEPIADKVRANFCEHFDPAPQPAVPQDASNTQDGDHLRQAAESLFK